jgi:hypothetical protein
MPALGQVKRGIVEAEEGVGDGAEVSKKEETAMVKLSPMVTRPRSKARS